jgi:hypothetical protein
MGKEARGAVVSVRLSDDQQARLRKIAEARGTSVSELIRTFVADETTPPVHGKTVAPAPTTAAVVVDRHANSPGTSTGYIRWTTSASVSESSGAALTLRANDEPSDGA